jgi:hypothetical protein
MDSIRIVGGRPLNGTIPISGAKNAALPLMIASLHTEVGADYFSAVVGTEYDPDTGEYEPHTAESLVPNDDASEWTLVLRPGLTFSDGTPLDAAAVEASISRYFDPAVTHSMKAGVLQIDEMYPVNLHSLPVVGDQHAKVIHVVPCVLHDLSAIGAWMRLVVLRDEVHHV